MSHRYCIDRKERDRRYWRKRLYSLTRARHRVRTQPANTWGIGGKSAILDITEHDIKALRLLLRGKA